MGAIADNRIEFPDWEIGAKGLTLFKKKKMGK